LFEKRDLQVNQIVVTSIKIKEMGGRISSSRVKFSNKGEMRERKLEAKQINFLLVDDIIIDILKQAKPNCQLNL
jgi:hypothetical protein